MKKIYLILFIIILTFVGCQDNPLMTNGTATELAGNVNVYIMYVSDGKVSFKMRDKDRYNKLLDNAERWLSKEASKYGKVILFNNIIHGSYDNTFVINEGINSSDFDSNIIIESIFGGQTNAISSAREKSIGNNVVFVIFTPLASFQSFCHVSTCPASPVESVVMAKTWNYDYEERKSLEIAHELLHAFGAIDYYNTNRFKSGFEGYIHQFDNSIMNRLDYHYDGVFVDEMTAYLVGWTEKKYDYFTFFNVE